MWAFCPQRRLFARLFPCWYSFVAINPSAGLTIPALAVAVVPSSSWLLLSLSSSALLLVPCAHAPFRRTSAKECIPTRRPLPLLSACCCLSVFLLVFCRGRCGAAAVGLLSSASVVLTWRGPGFASANPVAVVCLHLRHNKKATTYTRQRPNKHYTKHSIIAAYTSPAHSLSVSCTTCHYSCDSPHRIRQ